ncbi:hypothetical protein [Mycolicibacterium sediminis]|uniref:DUF4149 domain-containing protein n=1 Tax=Mycolicibacterium sediminis TaxID=1286180 RepID=A0A7I7QRS0_9MYCO|nr:hypothetical protein MSEDJ_30180 [Mycolicibacterium sediminis]
MDLSSRVAVGAVFVWLGMVLAISFLEAPLKFRAPGVTTQLGLGIGRLVFRALNFCELVFAIVIAATLFTHDTSTGVSVSITTAVAALLIQTVLIRPMLAKRTASVLAGEERARSIAHLAYVGFEIVKVAALISAGIVLLGG